MDSNVARMADCAMRLVLITEYVRMDILIDINMDIVIEVVMEVVIKVVIKGYESPIK